MDFLDPVAKKKKTRRLFFGYGLVTILISLATYVLAATAVGYEVFDFGDDVVQNGLLFLDSKPVSATISVDGKLEDDSTDTKLTLNGGEYTITLNQTGYSSWSKKIAIEGGKVRFVIYPRLIPTILTPTKLADLPANTGFTSQSPDLRWLVVQQNADLPAIDIFDPQNLSSPATGGVFPASILSNASGDYGDFEVVSWADDNRHFLLLQKLPNGQQSYLLIDRENLDLSVNLSTVFGVNPTSVSFKDKKKDKFYMYFATGGLLRLADLETSTIGEPILDQVLAYQSSGSDLIVYATTKDATAGKVAVKIFHKDTSYTMSELNFDGSNKYFLELSNFEGSWYYAVGSGASTQVQIFRNPLNFIAAKTPIPAAQLATLKAGIPESISFSPKLQRFIMVRSGQSVAVYDAEEAKSYRYDLPFTVDTFAKLSWAGPYHLQTVAGGKLQLLEFDGQNSRELLIVRGVTPGYFSKDFKTLYSISPTATASSLDLTSLVAPRK